MKSENFSNAASYSAAKKWLASLGVLCAGAMSAEEAELRASAMATLLSDAFAPWAFTQASLEYVARQCKFFPAYGEVRERLSAWVHENPLPRHTALPTPGGDFDDWSADDHSWLKFWRDKVAAGFPPLRDEAGHEKPTMRYSTVASPYAVDHRKAHAASLVQQMSPRAWAYIAAGKA